MGTLVILLTMCLLYQNVNSYVTFDLISAKMGEFSNSFLSTIKDIGYKVKELFSNEKSTIREENVLKAIHKTKRVINNKLINVIEATILAGQTESSNYLRLDSEHTQLMSTPHLAAQYGKKIESHIVQTQDGYILTLHHLLPDNDTLSSNRTVLLHHGLLGSSADWILLGAKKSLPHLLSRAGYDVWMANGRGNYYSRGHISMKIGAIRFWKFSWQQMGQYDLPAVINYIRKVKNNNETIDYIGHSMGATALLVLLSTEPIYNQFLRIGIFLAPLAFMNNIKGPLKLMSTLAFNPPEQLMNFLGSEEFLPSRKIPERLVSSFCNGIKILCRNPLLFLSGSTSPKKTWTASFFARLSYHVPAGGSTDTVLHYAQLARTGKFQKFNDISYEFPLNQVSLPIVMFTSSDDWLSTVPNVMQLFSSIKNPVDHHVIRNQNFTHTDFVWGTNADILVFNKLIDYLENGMKSDSIQNKKTKFEQ